MSEILKSRLQRGLPERMFHMREAGGFEVDLLIEEGDLLIGIEKKSAATIAPDFFVALR